ncbi:MAG: DUF5985 family protein [Bdellovibrionota bacterium]
MGPIVYMLCALTSFACALLLFRGNKARPSRLLFWSALCFMGLFVNNVVLFADMVIFPDLYLSPVRHGTALVSVLLLLYGLVWDVV